MFICTVKFDRKKAALAVVLAALVIIGIILMVSAHQKASAGDSRPTASVKSEKGRVAYLAQYGWEVETPAIAEEAVMIPRTFSSVFEQYNDLQKSQGFDLSRYCGTEVTMYTYRVANEGYDGDVMAVLYVSGGKVVGGDIHSTALDGFMRGIKNTSEPSGNQ